MKRGCTCLALLAFAVSAATSASGCAPSRGDDPDAGPGGAADADPARVDARPPPMNAAVYAHSASQLHRVDPDTLAVTLVGTFGWPGASDEMTDIAIDKDGKMTGVSYTKVYSVNKDTAACTYLADLSTQFNGLSYVPRVAADPNGAERLVGAANNGTIYEIDPVTGASTSVGSYGGGWRSSGDIVSVQGFGTVATVKQLLDTNDTLARIDLSTFQATPIGNTGFSDIWGLGFWGNKVYGFTDTSRFLLIDITTGVGTDTGASPVNWWGAGVTTTAPVIE